MIAYPFAPSPTGTPPYQFQPVLDEQTYNAECYWNVFGQRWYLQLSAPDGTLIFNRPIVGSPDGIPLSGLVFNIDHAVATTQSAHGLAVGTQALVAISGAAPDGYNGLWLVNVTGAATFTYPLTGDPGQALSLGSMFYNIDLAGGYFTASSLVFRETAQQFEVWQ